MPISTLTAITPIPEGSEATPGLWNSRFSQLQQNVQELNIQAIGLLSGFVSGGAGSPESVQTGTPGFLYVQLDAAAGEHPLWVKYTGSGTTGWDGFAGFKGTGADSYQFGRGAGASGENATAIARAAAARGSASQAWGYQAAANLDSDIAWGPNSRASGPNAIAGGLNAYAGFINAGALGSAATSNATGAWAFGAGTQASHQSALVFSATGGTSRNPHEMVMDYPVSSFSGAVGILRNDTYNWSDYLYLSDSSSTAYIGYGSATGGLLFRPPEDANGGTTAIYDALGQTIMVSVSTGGILLGSFGIANSRRTGLPYIPTCTGTPSQVPVPNTGFAPMVVDSINTRLYIYVGGVWKFAALS